MGVEFMQCHTGCYRRLQAKDNRHLKPSGSSEQPARGASIWGVNSVGSWGFFLKHQTCPRISFGKMLWHREASLSTDMKISFAPSSQPVCEPHLTNECLPGWPNVCICNVCSFAHSIIVRCLVFQFRATTSGCQPLPACTGQQSGKQRGQVVVFKYIMKNIYENMEMHAKTEFFFLHHQHIKLNHVNVHYIHWRRFLRASHSISQYK